MSKLRSTLALTLIVASLAACAGVRSPEGGACLPVSAMRLEMRHGDGWAPVAWLDNDGTFHQTVNRRGPAPVVRIAGDAVVALSNGKVGIYCDAAHVLHQQGSPFTMRFGPDDALADRMDRIYVRDDGMVEATFQRGRPQVAPWRVTARLPEERRTAELLVLLAMMSVDWSFH
jgi:hypothetical protein